MNKNRQLLRSRRGFLKSTSAIAALAALGFALPLPAAGTRIGVIGSGNVGSAIGELWVKAGHEVMFSSLDLEKDRKLAAKIGARASAGSPKEAAAFGQVLFFAVPYSAIPALGRELAPSLKGKAVLDASNPFSGRDGEIGSLALAKGAGIASAEYLAGARLVRAFNCVSWMAMRSEAHRAGDKLGIPLAGDDAAAVQTAVRLVQEAGFDPVVVGGLARAKDFDYGTPIFGKPLTAAGVRQILGVRQ